MAKPKIFVSHSSKDVKFASKFAADLNSSGAQAWLDDNNLDAGNFRERISHALANCEWFLLVLTRFALASKWVRQEVDAANRLKNQGKIQELVFIKAAEVEYHELPPLWGVYNVFDATADYVDALKRTLKVVGIESITEGLPTIEVSDTDLYFMPPYFMPPSDEWYPFDQLLSTAATFLRRKRYGEALAKYEEIIEGARPVAEGVRRLLPPEIELPVSKEASLAWIRMSFPINDSRAIGVDALRRAWEGKAEALLGLGRTEEAEVADGVARKWQMHQIASQNWKC